MKLWFLPVHIMTSKTLEQAKVDARQSSNKLISRFLDENATLKNTVDIIQGSKPGRLLRRQLKKQRKGGQAVG